MTKKATFGAGCFWGVESAFRQVDGVTATRVGLSGWAATGATRPLRATIHSAATPMIRRLSEPVRRARGFTAAAG